MATEADIFSELDQFDRKILAARAEDGRLAITDLATRVGLSKTPCQ
ncbi:AsnC family transcriptional regulator, partial [Rhizobium ruizarguesonis]